QPRHPYPPGRGRPRQDRLAGARDRARDAGELHRQQALVVPETALRRWLAALAALVAAGAFVGSAQAQTAQPRLTKERATTLFLADHKVADWLDRYPTKGRITDATYESDPGKCSPGAVGACWTVNVWWKKNDKIDAGEIATGKVDDQSGRVTE